jgi:rhodanese-related sulfurtransferase
VAVERACPGASPFDFFRERKFIMPKPARRKVQQRKNNNKLWIWGVFVLVILGAFAVWLSSPGTAEPGGYPREISVGEAVTKRDSGALILDVRQPEEWNTFHVPDSTLIPLGELSSRVNELPRDQEIVVVCRSGNRSAQARDILLAAGFPEVTSMAGGLTQWRAAGYPTVGGP